MSTYLCMNNEERKQFLKKRNLTYTFEGFVFADDSLYLEFYIWADEDRAKAYKAVGGDFFELNPCYAEIANKALEDITEEDDEIDELESQLEEYISEDDNFQYFYDEHTGELGEELCYFDSAGFSSGVQGTAYFGTNGKLYKLGKKIEQVNFD